MNTDFEPLFPIFEWDVSSWITCVTLPSWCGYEDDSESEIVELTFSDEDRGEEPLNQDEINLVQWIVDHEKAIQDSMLKGLFEEYPNIREQVLGWFEGDDITGYLPVIDAPEDFKKHIEVDSIYVHSIDDGEAPYFGITFGCPWDDEHGLGIMMHGTNVIEIGGIDTALLLWIAERYAKKILNIKQDDRRRV